MIRVFHNFSAPATINCLSTQFPTHLRQLYLSSFTGDFEFEEKFRQSHQPKDSETGSDFSNILSLLS